MLNASQRLVGAPVSLLSLPPSGVSVWYSTSVWSGTTCHWSCQPPEWELPELHRQSINLRNQASLMWFGAIISWAKLYQKQSA